jgi:hypothetical protein
MFSQGVFIFALCLVARNLYGVNACSCDGPIVQLNYENFDELLWNVKILNDNDQDPRMALGRSGGKVFMDKNNAWVITTKPNDEEICVQSVLLDVACTEKYEVRLMSLDPKEVAEQQGTELSEDGWNEERKEFGGFLANRIKIQMWPSTSGTCKRPTALRHVKIEYCAPKPPSCEGYCCPDPADAGNGAKCQNPFTSCWCDTICMGFGDCCPDYTTLCLAAP